MPDDGRNAANQNRPPRSNRLFVELPVEKDTTMVHINQTTAEDFGLKMGDFVLLTGMCDRQTVCVAIIHETPKDCTVCMNKYTRHNLRVRVGDVISVERFVNISYGNKIEVLPIDDTVNGIQGNLFDLFLKPYFAKAFRPVFVGDLFGVRGATRTAEFKVMSTNPSPVCIVTSDTVIVWNGTPLLRAPEECSLCLVGYDEVGGCKRALREIRRAIEVPIRHPEFIQMIGLKTTNSVLLYGLPGTGKSLIARAVANETGASFHMVNGPELLSKMYGESEANLRRVFREAASRTPAIIFFDEIDSIAPNRAKSQSDVDKRVVTQLLVLMDNAKLGSQVFVIAATTRPNSIDVALRRFGRFDMEVDLGIPDAEGRLEILKIHTENMRLAADLNLKSIADDTHGYVGADLAALCTAAAYEQIQEENIVDFNYGSNPEVLASLVVTAENFKAAMKRSRPSGLREHTVDIPNVTWKDVGGFESIKKLLQELILFPVEHPGVFAQYGLEPCRGILFYGPPGCGKTLLAKAIANECKANFISIKGSELLTKWFGESEAKVREVFEKARSVSPCVIFFDEFHALARACTNSASDAGAADRVVAQLLTEMDGFNPQKSVFVIAATNRPDVMEPAILRPGRIDHHVYIPLPDELSRLMIFNAVLLRTPLSDKVSLQKLAETTEGFSGADITGICKMACTAAIRDLIEQNKDKLPEKVPPLRVKHFKNAMKNARRSVAQSDLDVYERFRSSL